jgi:serine protease Do
MSSLFSLCQLSTVFTVLFLSVWGGILLDDRVLSTNEPIQRTPTTNSTPTPQPSPMIPNPREISRSITVKIGAPDFIGSGTIVGLEKGAYTVITNAHVLRSANPPYRIITIDRVVHQAKVLNYSKLKDYDLAILQFRSPSSKYSVAKVGNSGKLKVGDRLFVGGFTKQAHQHSSDNFLLQSGSISIILDRSIESGYRLGYTHQIFRGMSGGPVLDRSGLLVGINGLLNDPVWKTYSKFADGSIACEPLQLLLDRSSLGIPIEDIIKLIPRSQWWQKETPPTITNSRDNPQEAQERKNLEEAANKALSCR